MAACAFGNKAGAADQILVCGKLAAFHGAQICLKARADDKRIGVAAQIANARMSQTI